MKSIIICFFIIFLMLACQKSPFDPGETTQHSSWIDGPRLAKFNGDDGIAVVFVDADKGKNLVSVHSLTADLDLADPECMYMFKDLEDSVESQKLWNLVNSNEHYVYVLEVTDDYLNDSACRLGICCQMLKESKLAFTGTGFIEISDFPWLDIEQEVDEWPFDDDPVLPKATSDFTISGFGEVCRPGESTFAEYAANCNMTFKYSDKFEQNYKVDILAPNNR